VSHPRISILMPFHNEAAFLAEAVGSVVAQSEPDFELIAVDDGSIDDGAAIVRSFSDPRIRLLQPGKVGKNAALNLAFSVSRGALITFFCGDDTLPLDSLKHKVEALSPFHPLEERVMGYGKARLMSTDAAFNGIIVPRDPVKGSDSASAQVFTRALAESVFPLPEQLPNEDQWSALCARFFADHVLHIPVVVWNYRIHSGNSHNRFLDFEAYSAQYHARFQVYEVFLNHFETRLPAEARRWLTWHARLEDLRWQGRLFQLLFANVPLKERLRALIYGSKLLFNFRMRHYGWFAGR
jgi:glycosyltransferase involved in cell wall biosynthesis